MTVIDRMEKFLDDVGNFGFPSWYSQKIAIYYMAGIIALFCALGFLSATTAYSTDLNTLKTTAFAVSTDSGVSTYYGLQSLVFESNGVISIINYKSAACNTSTCSSCFNSSGSTFGLLLADIFLAFIVCALSILRVFFDGAKLKVTKPYPHVLS